MKCSSIVLTVLASFIAIASLAQTSLDSMRAQALIKQAKKYYFHAQYDSLRMYSQQALAAARQNSDPASIAQALNLTGVAYFSEGDLLAAQQYFDSTRIAYESSGDSLGLTLALCNLGHVQESYGDYEQALHYYWNEFSVSEAIGDVNKMGAAYEDIGRVQQAQGNYSQALPYYEQALAFFQSRSDSFYVASTLRSLGNLHTQHLSWEKGVAYLKQALEITDLLNNPDQKADLLNSLANAYHQHNQPAQAMQLYDQALQINTRRVSLRTRLHSLIGAGDAASDLQQIPAAKHWLEEASRWISQSPADPQNQLHLQQTLTKFYKATRQYALALKHYETANLLEDSLLNAEKIKRLSELQTRYETEKKDREITSLQYQKAAQEASLARRSWQRNLFIGLLLAVLLISGLVYRTIRLKQRHQRVLLSREQELHEAKSRFFTDIAHEFRSPLTLIQGPAEQIILHSTDPNCRQQAKLIRKQSGRLLQLVNQILYLSRLEAGVISQHRREQDLVSFLRGMVHAYESLAEQLKLNLCFSSSISRYITSFDKDQFEKIFTNLLTNACKFTPPQGKISLEISTPQAHEVVIIVRDTGRGISEEHLPSIFDRYYTASGTHADASGAGIGLALTKELVELHGGTISAHSSPGEETLFRIVLPTCPSPTAAANQPPVSQPIQEIVFSTQPKSPIETARLIPVSDDDRSWLLVIDDNPEIRSYLASTLSQQYSIIEASHGEEGLELAYEHVPDLIISDVLMTGITGYEVCQQLKKDERTSHIPVILLTGRNGTEARIAGLEVQADDYLTKPFNSRELQTRIANLIQIRKSLLARSGTETTETFSSYATLPSREKQFIDRMTTAVEEHLSDDSFGVTELCQAVGMSRTQLHRKLKVLTGESTTTFVRQVRLRHSMKLLQTSDLSVSEIAYLVGFGTPAYFSTRFTEQYGYPPSQVRSDHIRIVENK